MYITCTDVLPILPQFKNNNYACLEQNTDIFHFVTHFCRELSEKIICIQKIALTSILLEIHVG